MQWDYLLGLLYKYRLFYCDKERFEYELVEHICFLHHTYFFCRGYALYKKKSSLVSTICFNSFVLFHFSSFDIYCFSSSNALYFI